MLWLLWFLMRNLLSPIWCSSTDQGSFLSLVPFKIFLFLPLAFRSLKMMCLGVNFFDCILFEVCSASGICLIMLFSKFGKFSATFSAHMMTPMLDLLQWSKKCLRLFTFVFQPIFSLSDMIIFIIPPSSSLIHSSVILFCY